MDNLTVPVFQRLRPLSVQSLQLKDGFAGQDMYVVPRPILSEAARHPLVRPLYPTDIGWFPSATHHYRDRKNGANQDHLILCVNGHGFAVIDGKKVHLQSGQLMIIPRHVKHTYWAAEDVPWSIYWMHFLGEEAEYYVERIPRSGEPVAVDDATRDEAYPLDETVERACFGDDIAHESVAVFWYGPTRTAVAFSSVVEGQQLTFYADKVSPETAPFKDRQTGSRWTLAGRAVDGPLRGKELRWLNSIQSRWYAWASTNPETLVYELK